MSQIRLPSLFMFTTLAQVRDVIFSDRERSLNRNEEFPDLFAENEIQADKYYIKNYIWDKTLQFLKS